MANYISKYLRQAGIKAPYADLTEAQIEEKNKLNPLGGYGFMSAKEKQAKRHQQEMIERQMQMEQELYQQQLLSRMSSQQQIGHHAGSGLMGLVNMLKSKGQAPEVPGGGQIWDERMGGPQDDPEVARYNQLSAEVGPEVALQMLGQEMQNPAMIADAEKAIAEKQKSKLEMEDLQGKVEDRKKKPNETINVQVTGPNGEPMMATWEKMGKDKDGNNLYRELGKAVKGSVVDTNEGFGLTRSQGGKQTIDFQDEMTNTENLLDVSDRIVNLAQNSPTGPGFASKLAGSANNLVYGFEGIRNIVAGNLGDNKAKAKLASSNPVAQYKSVFDNMRGAAKTDSKLQALLLEQAYLKATANGQRATDKDIENALKELGGHLNDPEAFAEVIQQNREVAVDKLFNKAKNTGGPNGQTFGDVYSQRLGGIKARRNPGAQDKQEEEKLRKRLEELRLKHKGNK